MMVKWHLGAKQKSPAMQCVLSSEPEKAAWTQVSIIPPTVTTDAQKKTWPSTQNSAYAEYWQ